MLTNKNNIEITDYNFTVAQQIIDKFHKHNIKPQRRLMSVKFTKKELIEINVSVSQNLSKFKDTLKDHEKKTLESIFNKTIKIINPIVIKPKIKEVK